MSLVEGGRRVAVTGLGVVSALGAYPGAFWEQLLAGVSGTREIENFDTSGLASRIAGLVRDFDPVQYVRDPRDLVLLDRTSQFAIAATELARRDAALERHHFSTAAVIIGSGFGCVATVFDGFSAFVQNGIRATRATSIPRGMANAPAAAVSIALGAQGPHYVIASACASGTIAIGHAARLVATGLVPLAVAGGADAAVIRATLASWCAMRVVSRRNETPASACRPFSADRDGFVFAEGAGMIVLEDLQAARARHATVYAEVTGYGEASDACHFTNPSVDGEVRAMRAALASAGLTGADIGYINAHGTATALNDNVETRAFHQVLGPHAAVIPVSATKSMTGHAMGASGAIEVAATALAIRDQRVHPTANFTSPDPECDLDYVADGARAIRIDHAMKTSFAFGGANAAIVLSRSPQ